MDGVLSQEEINALLNNPGASSDTAEGQLSDSEKDTIGEIANISMGTAATTLFSLVNRKVEISTPVVTMANWDDVGIYTNRIHRWIGWKQYPDIKGA